jgi:ligand-binding SRPBCC domain-containing protein
MSICPIASVNAPVEQVWALLSEPGNYVLWWDAQTRSIEPKGAAQPGQKIQAQSRAIGKGWDVTITVEKVDSSKRQIDLTTSLPLGITVHNHIVCAPLDGVTCLVTFG